MTENHSDSARGVGEPASAGQEDRRGVEPGDPALARGVSSDVTATQAAEALRVAGESFRHLVEQSPFGVYAVDADFRLVMVSAGAQKVFQNVRPLLGRDFDDVMHVLWPEPFVSEVLGLFRHTLATGEPYRAASTVERRADIGDTEAYDWKLERVILPDGRPGVVCHFYDLSERQRYEAALRESEERFRTLADNMSQFTWMADASGWIFWYNRRWFDYTGTTLEEMQGWGWKKVHHPDHVDRVVDKFSIHIASGKEWEDTFPLRGTDGQYRWFLSRAVPIRDADGRITRWFGTNTDVTEQRAAEEALREADRRKDEFLAMLAHELRNPLAPIRSAVQILRKVGSQEPLAKTARDVIDRQTVHLSRLVDELLDVSRISRAKIQLRTELCDLAAIIRQSAEDYRSTVEGNGLQLEVDLPQHPLFVNGDPTRLSQVVGNLLQNAIKFTDGGGQVTVQASADAGTAVVTVKDTGVGMEPGLIAHLFEAFTQADRSLDRSRGGLGLGLALVKGLMEMHGGTVAAYSDGPGKGSTLRFNLPLSNEAPAPSVEAAAGVSQRGLRILIIEDNPDAAESVRMLLSLDGHLVETADDGPRGLERARELRPHVVLCDIGLPGEMDGYAVARTLRAESDLAPLRLVALTGYGQEDDLRCAIDAGFDHHLVKPAEYEDLTAIFDSIFL